MSVVLCVECGAWIDSDEHPECFDKHDRPFCYSCAIEAKDSKDYTRQVEEAMKKGDADAIGTD